MRLTAYITTCGERTLTRMLSFDSYLKDVSPDGKFDETQARRALAGVPGVVMASDDCAPVYAFAMQTIDYAHHFLRQMADRPGSSDHAESRQDERCEERMERGKCAYARMDIKWRCGHIRVTISGGNPNGCVGSVDIQVHETCVFFAYIMQCIQENVSDYVEIEVIEGENAEGAIEEARRQRLESDLFHKGERCERRQGCYCSPADPSCPNFKDGRCIFAERDK